MSKSQTQGTSLPIALWIIVALNLFIGIFLLVLNFSKEDKLVYVDSTRLIAKYKGVETARNELNKKSMVWKSNLDTLRKEVEIAISDYNKSKTKASARERQLMEELIKSKQNQFLGYEQTIKDQYQKEDQEVTQKILTKLNDYLKRYGEQKGYNIILAATQYGNIAYADKSVDITDEVLKGLNDEYEKSK